MTINAPNSLMEMGCNTPAHSLTSIFWGPSPIWICMGRLIMTPAAFFVCAVGGQRQVKMAQNFFVGYRQTLLEPSEILLYVDMPHTTEVYMIIVQRLQTCP